MAGGEQQKLRQYLLGLLTETEEEQVELRLLTEPGFAEEFDIAANEIIDDYIIGKFEGKELEQVERHFFKSPERRNKLKFALALKEYKSYVLAKRRRRNQFFQRSLAIAASLLLVCGGFYLWRVRSANSELNQGLAALQAAFRDERPLEARISRFDYAPYLATRGPGTENIDQNELGRAELMLLDALKKNPTPAAHYALGKVFLAKKDFDRAIKEFDEAIKGDPKNAQLYSDLSAAWLEKGKRRREDSNNQPTRAEPAKVIEDFLHSLDNLNKALELDPNLLDALFNRALVREEMVLPQAEADWREYLERDPNSQWAIEAKRHLNEIQERTKTQSQSKQEPIAGFLAASQANDHEEADEIMSANTEAIGGRLLWWQLAVAYLRAAVKPQDNDVKTYLQALEYAGALQQKRSGDPFVSELARFYGSCTRERLGILARAHVTMNEAHELMARSEAARALPLYQKAKAEFDSVDDTWEGLYAVYWIGYSNYRKSHYKEALETFSELTDACRSENYLWLLEKATIGIGSILAEEGEFSTGLNYQKQSLEIAERMNSAYATQKNLSQLAYTYRALANRDQALGYLQRCLESARAHWTGVRQMYRNYYAAADILNSFGHYDAAVLYEEASLNFAFEQADPVFQNQSYVSLAAIHRELGNYREALKYAGLAKDAAQMVDEQTGLKPLADSLLQLGHASRQTQSYDGAIAYYDQALTLYDSKQLYPYVYEAHKGKLLTYVQQGNDTEAQKELPNVLALFEEYRSKIKEEQNRTSFFDLEQNLYDIAVDFENTRIQDKEKAFEYAEQSRARSMLDLMESTGKRTTPDNSDLIISSLAHPLPLGSIRERMPPRIQVLQYAVLNDKLLIWVISSDGFEGIQENISSASLTEKVLNYSELISTPSRSASEETRRAAMELYSILIKPVELLLDKQKQICIIPDKVLNRVSFAALVSPDTNRFLLSDYLVSFAPSSNVLIAASESARLRSANRTERLLAVGDPYFDRNQFPDLPYLPSSGRETRQIGAYYQNACSLIGNDATKERIEHEMERADVIQIASHYVVDEHNPMFSKLLLTPDTAQGQTSGTSTGVLEAYEIYQRKLPVTRLVVLSACGTAGERYYNGEGMIGMSRPFLVAGVPLVTASLWPVASDSTADLMTSFHRYRSRGGLNSAAALRQAQLDMLNDPEYAPPYYWAPFVLIGGYANF